MSSESQAVDYTAVLADLRAKRDQLDQAIQAIETLQGIKSASGEAVGAASASGGGAMAEGPGAYLGMSIPDAAKKLLTARRQPMNNSDIWAALKAGGLHLNSREPVNTIGSVMTRRFNVVGDIVRVGRGTWGLKEWYPNRSFKDKGGKADAEAGSE